MEYNNNSVKLETNNGLEFLQLLRENIYKSVPTGSIKHYWVKDFNMVLNVIFK